MKRILLSSSLALATGLLFGQGTVVVQVLTPESIADTYNNVFAVEASMWGVADLTDPANAVEGVLALVSDGTTADSLGCSPLVNGEEIDGKIAVVYRGTCGFSVKALHAQDAGAIGVLLLSNGDDLAINMQGGDLGPQVTIPVAMISMTSGATIRPVLDTEEVTAFIGNTFGAFPNNLNLGGEDMLVPAASAVPALVAQNASEFQVEIGSWMHNFGSADQSTVRLRATVMQGGTEVYNEVSDNQFIPSGDSVFVQLAQFTQPSYAAAYDIIYTVESDEQEAAPNDNTYTIPLTFGDIASYAPIDPVTNRPIVETTVVPAEPEGAFRTCVQFSDTNASRLVVTGLYFAAQTPADDAEPLDSVLTDLLLTSYAWWWSDEVTGPFTLPTDAGLNLLSAGVYSYTDDLQREMVFIPFEETIIMEDNLRYLFCVETAEPFVRHGWNESVDYGENGDFGVIDPTSVLRTGTNWFNGFTGLAGAPAIGIQTADATTIGIAENNDRVEVTPYPNPTTDRLSIPLKGLSGAATLQLFDLTGKKVGEQKVAVGADHTLVVDVRNISTGTYMFHMEFENGKRSDFRVVVTR